MTAPDPTSKIVHQAVQAIAARARARRAESRTFTGAQSTGRIAASWRTGQTSINAEISSGISVLRSRSRDLIQNNPYAARAAQVWVDNEIGAGIIGVPSRGGPVWDQWVESCDVEGRYDLWGIQALVSRTIFESGSALVRLRWQGITTSGSIPLKLQVLEPDYIDLTKNETVQGGGYIELGIEYDSTGRRVAYWLYDQHPGAQYPFVKTLKSNRVSAADILHIFESVRPGQSHGIPKLAPVILKLRNLDDYQEAELLRKGIEACFAAVVTSDDPHMRVATGDVDIGTVEQVESISAGMFTYLRPGEKVTFGQPSPVAGYSDGVKQHLKDVAAGIGIPYAIFSGDHSEDNYSTMRGGMMEFRRGIDRRQWTMLIPQFCKPVAEAFRTAALMAGLQTFRNAKFEWTPPKWDWVDPLKDVTGVILELAAGLTSWEEEARKRGWTASDLLAQIKANQSAFAEAGIALQWDKLMLGAMQANTAGGSND